MEKIFALANQLNKEPIKIEPIDDMEKIMGQIISNRIVGIAFNNLDLNSIHPEFRKSLNTLKLSLDNEYKSFSDNLKFVSNILKQQPAPYAFLKGALLATQFYGIGERTSGDIDLLIQGKDLSLIEEKLKENYFIQGNYVNGKIVPASRVEIIRSRLNFGETVPFLIMRNNRLLKVDLNFSLDFKPDNPSVVSQMLDRTESLMVDESNYTFQSLDKIDAFVYLCCHLFKEATTYEWVETKRDLMLYKFSDINVFLNKFGTREFFDALVKRGRELGKEREIYFAVITSSIFFQNIQSIPNVDRLLSLLKPGDLSFMKQVIDPVEKKTYEYHTSLKEWFFTANRASELKMV